MSIVRDIDKIIQHSHFWNWGQDWNIVKNIYKRFPESHSVLTPFAYAYMEELIRSMTSEYGRININEDGNPESKNVGYRLVKLAIDENKEFRPELASILEQVLRHYKASLPSDRGENRNSVVHGLMHSRFWDEESFETLIHEVALLSEYAGF